MKFPVPLSVVALFPLTAGAQYLPPDTYFSGGGPAYAPVPQADNVTVFSPAGLTAAGYQWWANNVPVSQGPKNGPPARVVFGDLPPVAYEMADLRLPWAWEMTGPAGARISGLGVKVAVVDNGIDRNHPDFVAGGTAVAAVDTDNNHHWNYSNGTNSPQPGTLSTDTHGTAMAGMIGAHQGAGVTTTGLAGIAPRGTLQGLVVLKGFVDSDKWADAFAFGSTLTDSDHDGELLDETRTGLPFCDVCLNAQANLGAGAAGDLSGEEVSWKRAIRHGATQGRGGRGVVYVTSAGDGGEDHMNTNYLELKNSIFQIPVTGVSDMGRRIASANAGANIVCAAPTWGQELPPVLNWPSRPAGFPTNRAFVKGAPMEPDDVPSTLRRRTQGVPVLSTQSRIDFNGYGTGASAAQVAGIVALMLEKRPDLTARDVKEILLRSGRVVNDVRFDTNSVPLPYEPSGPGSGPQQTYPWPSGGPHPPPTLMEGPTQWRMSRLGRPLHPALGAGLIDARRALKIAERWRVLPADPFPPVQIDVLAEGFGTLIANRTTETGGVYFPVISNALIPLNGTAVEVIVPPPPEGMRLEHVEVRVRLYHKRRGDLEIKLVAPGDVAWDGAGRTMVSDLFVPHREDYNEDRWHATNVSLRDPLDWTFTTVRHWGTTTPDSGGGLWRVVFRDAVNKGATTSTTANDPVFCAVVDPTDAQSQRVEGVAITYHGTTDSPEGETAPWDPPVITMGPVSVRAATGVAAIPLEVVPLGAGPDGLPAFPVTSWDFFHLRDIVPVHAAAPAKPPFVYYPPGVSVAGAAPATALYATLNNWPATPAWVPLTTPPAAPVTESAGAMVSRPRWAELSADGRFIVLRDGTNTNGLTNFLHARLNRALGVLEIIPRNTGSYRVNVVAENLVGISQPTEISITVTPNPGIYAHWLPEYFTPSQIGDAGVSGPDADPDQDGYSNRLEHALAGNPLGASTDRCPEAGYVDAGGSLYATLIFTRRTEIDGATVSVQFSGDLSAWDRPAILTDSVPHGGGTVTETWRSAAPVSGEPRIFGRVLVTTNS